MIVVNKARSPSLWACRAKVTYFAKRNHLRYFGTVNIHNTYTEIVNNEYNHLIEPEVTVQLGEVVFVKSIKQEGQIEHYSNTKLLVLLNNMIVTSSMITSLNHGGRKEPSMIEPEAEVNPNTAHKVRQIPAVWPPCFPLWKFNFDLCSGSLQAQRSEPRSVTSDLQHNVYGMPWGYKRGTSLAHTGTSWHEMNIQDRWVAPLPPPSPTLGPPRILNLMDKHEQANILEDKLYTAYHALVENNQPTSCRKCSAKINMIQVAYNTWFRYSGQT